MVSQVNRMKVLATGAASFAVVALLQLVALPSLDLPLQVAAFCFAIALPLSAGHAVIAFFCADETLRPMDNWYMMTTAALYALATGGAAFMLFLHFSPWLSWLFLAMALLGTILVATWQIKIDKAVTPPATEPKSAQ